MIQPVSNITFEHNLYKNTPKLYREKLKKEIAIVNGDKIIKKVHFIKEYKNPEAKAILKKLRNQKITFKEKKELEMTLGHYRVIYDDSLSNHSILSGLSRIINILFNKT